MGRHRSKVYPDYVTAVLHDGQTVREVNGSYYLYERASGSSKPVYCGRIMPDSSIVRRNRIQRPDSKATTIDASTNIETLRMKDYVTTQTADYEFGFTHFILSVVEKNSNFALLSVTDRCAILTEIITSISSDSYLSKHPIEMKRKHFFIGRKKELILELGKMGIHIYEAYDLLKSIRMYEASDGTVSVSKVSDTQSSYCARWGIVI